MNGLVPQQPDVNAAFLYSKLKAISYMHLPEGNRDSNEVEYLKRYKYGLILLPREWYTHLSTHLGSHGFDISNVDPCVLRYKTDKFYIGMYVEDLILYGPSGY
jgi:hypothetical protein